MATINELLQCSDGNGGTLNASDVRGVLGDIGARALNLGNKEGDALSKRVLLLVGKLDAMVQLQGILCAEFKQLTGTAADVAMRLRKAERKQQG